MNPSTVSWDGKSTASDRYERYQPSKQTITGRRTLGSSAILYAWMMVSTTS